MRPEETSGRIHNHLTDAANYPMHPKLVDSAALDALYSRYGTDLCPQAYPEGCPTHPAYPGAIATIGGASVAVLKQLFNQDFEIPNPVVPATMDSASNRGPVNPSPSGRTQQTRLQHGCRTRHRRRPFRPDEVRGILLGEWY